MSRTDLPHEHKFKKAYIEDRKSENSTYNGKRRWILLSFCPECRWKQAYDLTTISPKR